MGDVFGEKKWYKSMTAWGVILFSAAQAGLGGACGEAMLLPEATCSWITSALTTVGGILTVLGLRRAAN